MMAAEKLRDLSQLIDVGVLDATIAASYGTGSKEERTYANQILRELQNNPDMLLQVGHILSKAQNLNTKFFALQVLEGAIKYRWNVLPVEQRDGTKNYISDAIVKLSSNEGSFRQERLYVNRLNNILVQILKHEWPARWRSFIPDLVTTAKTSETICENSMAILKLLGEEVCDFLRGEMVQHNIEELKQSLNSEFQLIHELCLYVLSTSQRTELIRATLDTLLAFRLWIRLGYISESPLLKTLLEYSDDFRHDQNMNYVNNPLFILTHSSEKLSTVEDSQAEIKNLRDENKDLTDKNEGLKDEIKGLKESLQKMELGPSVTCICSRNSECKTAGCICKSNKKLCSRLCNCTPKKCTNK